MGPTCTGKTALALQLAQRFPLEIVSVDSALVYRGMDVGTSKPSPRRARRGAASPDRRLRSARSRIRPGGSAAMRSHCIDAIRARGRVPLLVGGTMLYFRALTHGLAPLPEADAQVRAALDARARANGAGRHCTRNSPHVDPEAGGAHPSERRAAHPARARSATRSPASACPTCSSSRRPAPSRWRGLRCCPLSRAELYERIERRFDAMLAAGFLDEVRALRARGDLHRDLPSLRAVGYRQLWEHLDGACARVRDGRGRREAGHAQPGQAPTDVAAGRSGHPCG